MKSPLCVFPVSVAVFLCVSFCSSIYPGKTARAALKGSPPDIHSGGAQTSGPPAMDSITLPGPLRSFLRMAGISQQVSPEDVLPLLARNIYTRGYEEHNPTEFLILVQRYIHQARELQILAGDSGTIRVGGCDDAGTLVQILGYRLRQGCGQKSFSLETANPERAFLTIDSGFPLVELEEALQKDGDFTYRYPNSRLPVLFHESDWMGLATGQKHGSGGVVEALVTDPAVARLYWALAKDDVETRIALERSPGLRALLPFAAVLDFYGSQIFIRSGRVIVPGGARAETEWKELVGASPEAPGEFVAHLLAKDNGELAAYFDVLSRVSQAQQEHLMEAPRLKRLYEDFRAGDTHGNAVRGVFRRDPELLVLFTRVQWEPDGAPHVPGDVETWKEILRQKTDSKVVHDWAKRARGWNRPEEVLEAMTAFSSMESDQGPLQIYLMLSELDRGRQPADRLSPETVRLLASRFTQFKSWYLVFTEFPDLNDASIARFLNVAETIARTPDQALRGNSLGAFQATLGLWQILARQGEIPNAELNSSWQKAIEPFASISFSSQLFDAARNSLEEMMAVAGGKGNQSAQEEVVDLLAGPHQESPDGQRTHQELTRRIGAVLDDQRLVSLDTLFALSDGLKEMESGAGKGDRLLPLAAELREFDLPRPIFTQSEKITWTPTVYTNRHAELQIRTDLTRVIKAPGSPAQLEMARGQLAAFLRDSLVGLNYAYYEPPGAQVLHHNPLFVRSHDFLGVSVFGSDQLWAAPELLGAGSPAGGGAYLMGSLADLSYSLAMTEADFLAPKNVQALIWKELVPVLVVSATLPRWWNVTPNELHAATLYQRSGEEILAASAGDAQLRDKVVSIFSDHMTMQRMEWVEQCLLHPEDTTAMLPRMMPAETFYLAAEYRRRFPGEAPSWGPASKQLEDLRSRYPKEVDDERLAKDFGVPHPTLARTNSRELLNVKPFPFFASYSSRLFGESWESTNLYWARLVDETGYSPVAMNSLVPELTRRMITNIFATEYEDWPALLRAMQETGEEFRQGKIVALPAANSSAALTERAVREAKAQ
jgi:hypothetical protein